MGELPDLSHGLYVETIAVGHVLVRIHTHPDPIFFGPAPGRPPTSRFDAPAGECGTMYVADRLEGAAIETVLRRHSRIVSLEFLARHKITLIEPFRGFRLAKLYDEGLKRHGLDARVSASEDYQWTRNVACAIHAHPDRVDGIAYRARHDNGEVCFALFDRVASQDLHCRAPRGLCADQVQLGALLDRYGVAIDPLEAMPDDIPELAAPRRRRPTRPDAPT